MSSVIHPVWARRRSAPSRVGATVALLMTLALVSCGSKPSPAGHCTSDQQCPVDNLCMVGTCLPRGMNRTVAVDILPRTDSPAARTGLASVALGPGQIALAADDRVLVEGTVTNAPNAHVILTVPSPIPGQPDLQFESDLANFKFQLGVGNRLLRSMATVWLTPNIDDPLMPQQQLQPPVPFTAMLDWSLNFAFPAVAQMTVLRGALHDSLDMPVGLVLVRAMVGDKVVSNVAATDNVGMYQLLIAPGSVSAENDQNVILDFSPTDPNSGPRFQTVPFSLAAAAGAGKTRIIRMPAFLTPAPLRFLVQATDTGAPLTDVTVRFHTEIVTSPDGVALYDREARSDWNGEVQANLIPGTATEPRNYQITIVPPLVSPYATKCVSQHPVTIVGNGGQPQYSKTFYMDPKVTLQGTVLASDASPAAAVSVTATQLSASADCASSLSATPVSATTLRTGAYQMLIDPGTYQLDIEPAMGSPLPRLTEDGNRAVVVTPDPVTNHDVALPAGEVVEGDVKGMDNMPLGAASLKIYQVLCQSDTCGGPGRIPPSLQAQTRSDTSGHFRAVLPLP